MPESRVWIDTRPGGLHLLLQLPLNRLEFAYGQPLIDQPATVLARHGEGLSRYLLQHVGARSGAVGWQVLRPQLRVVGSDGAAELEAEIDLRAPPGGDARQLTLLYDAVTHEVRTHRVLVALRNDWAGGQVGQPPRPLGELRHGHQQLELALAPASVAAGLWQLAGDGAQHIATGSDHLMFLLLLMLVAPLTLAPGTRRAWGGVQPAPAAWRRTALLVTAFTVGHTVTLVLGSSGLLRPPVQAVEVAVALTIAVAALHAGRPLFARADAAMALGFGLIHGLAFSASLSGAGLTALQHGLALLAFNAGIEAMQLLLVLAVLPPLLWLAQRQPRASAWLRRAVAAAACALALWWVIERLGLLPAAWLA
ncbi:HupE/UreJ family protein [Aquabacterium sp. OR-4]|uniref:HupE/UreJ family protein n=1 Tax=Aquabacterium sp. OR-4 TaxID=2978127 RepID=UPI0021B244A2|nr:HupE/UreJ family protein [Aquabacterium sp. OR-4]MDT7838033.1 HupE/UreJ family protein [Aquabacterium sp. OR-4]